MYRILALMLLLPLCSRAQIVPRHERPFIQSEMRQAKTLLERSSDAVAADARYDVTYYGLDIAITTSPGYLRGSVVMRAVAAVDGLSSLTIDLMSSLQVDSVFVNDTAAAVVRSTSSYDVVPARALALGEVFKVKTYYQGVPGSSGFGSFVFSSHSGTPWVWTLSEPYGAKDWWPCKDHPIDKADSVDVTVRCDTAFKVASNGRLIGITPHGDGTHSYAWQERYPISTYLVFVSITNYAEFTNWFHYGVADSMPVLSYVLPEHLSSALANLPRTVDMLGIYSGLFGLYPFVAEKYGHNEFGWGGAMEHQTMTSTTGFDEYTVAHELTHQWFGDLITCRTWADLWLNEGFASYGEALYAEQKYGTAAYWSIAGSDVNSGKFASGTLYVQDTSNVGNLFTFTRVYAKGSAVLHMLRHVVGDSVFFASMKNYAATPSLRYGTAATADFQQAVESTSGKDLDYFFNEWVFGERYPKYSFGWSSSPDAGGYRLLIHVSQSTGTLNPVFFTMPVDFKITSGGWDTTVVLFNDSLAQTFDIVVSHPPTQVNLDPDNWIMKDIIQSFSFSRASLLFSNPPVFYGSERTDSLQATNNGPDPVTIVSAVTTNPEFTVTPSSAIVGGFSSVKFYVTFRPQNVGQRVGMLLFTHSGPTSPDSVSLVGFGALQSYYYPVEGGWNILSLPLIVPDPRPGTVFPGAATPAYMYDTLTQNYYAVDSLRPGRGYWLRYATGQSISVGGLTFLSDTLPLRAGWNLVGAVSVTVPVASVQSSPPGILVSPFYDYNGSYCLAESLRPASGYWIKASAPGTLLLSGAGPAPVPTDVRDRELVERCGVIAVTDASGSVRRLVIAAPGEPETELQRYALPPPPPAGVFDVRFSSNSFIGAAPRLPLRVTAASYPLHIWVERPLPGCRFTLQAGGDERDLSPEGIDIGAERTLTLITAPSDAAVPTTYALAQNYPNPFNPRTSITYGLPVRSQARLEVYDLAGRLVSTLVQGSLPAGTYTAEWRGRSDEGAELASGVYVLRLTALPVEGTPFTSVRKMLLIR